MDARITPYLPDCVELYYVDYRDSLDEHYQLLQDCLTKNEFYPITESLCDWWDYPEGEYIREIETAMINDDVEDAAQIVEDNFDEIREWLWEKDSSTPLEDLLDRTTVAFFYSTGLDVDCGWHCGDYMFAVPFQNESYKMGIHKVCQKLGIKKDSNDYQRICQLVEQSNGGDLRIYWEGDIRKLISKDEHDFQSIHFKGSFLIGVINSYEGSGDADWFDIDLELPFMRENVFVSRIEKYGLEEIFGRRMTNDSDEPTLSVNRPKTRKKIALSDAALRIATERKYDEVFKAGGCTYGDTDTRRHRDVYYENNIPCGLHCPHCGQFWID